LKHVQRRSVRLGEVRVIGSSAGIGIFVEVALAVDPPLAITCNVTSCTYARGQDGSMTIYVYGRIDELVGPLEIRLSYGSYSVTAEITMPLCRCINSGLSIVAIHSIKTADIGAANALYFLKLDSDPMREDCINTVLVSVNGLPVSYLVGYPALRLTPGLYVQAIGGAARCAKCSIGASETLYGGKGVCVDCGSCVAAGCGGVYFSEKLACLEFGELVRGPLVLYDIKNGNLLNGEKLIVDVFEKMLRVAVASAAKLLELINDIGPYLADAGKVSYYAAVIEDLL